MVPFGEQKGQGEPVLPANFPPSILKVPAAFMAMQDGPNPSSAPGLGAAPDAETSRRLVALVWELLNMHSSK